MSNIGYINLHRSILDWEWYKDSNTTRVFLHFLLKANYKTTRWQGVEIMPGQLIAGRKQLAVDLKLSEQEIRTSINKLKSTNEITIQSTNRFSVITICKWVDYQYSPDSNQPTDQPIDQLSGNQQSTTPKKGEEGKENRKSPLNIILPSSLEIEAFFLEKIIELGLEINPKTEAIKFESYYSSKNWMVGSNKMTNWKSSVSGWLARDNSKVITKPSDEKNGKNEFDFKSITDQRLAGINQN